MLLATYNLTMRKVLLIIGLSLIAASSFGQSWTQGQYTEFKGVIANEVLRAPRRDTIALGGSKDSVGQIVYRPADTTLYVKTPNRWIALNLLIKPKVVYSLYLKMVPVDTTIDGNEYKYIQLPALVNKHLMLFAEEQMVYHPVNNYIDIITGMYAFAGSFKYDAAAGRIMLSGASYGDDYIPRYLVQYTDE